MKLKALLYFLFFTLHFTLSFGQSWNWGTAGYMPPGSDNNSCTVTTDKNGTAYITGRYSSSVIFGSNTLACSGENAYLVKYDSAGSILWAIQPTDSASSTSSGSFVATDKPGNIYVSGLFNGLVTFGTFSLRTEESQYSAFLVKYSPSGNVIWAKQASGSASSYSYISSAAVDDSGNIVVTGYFRDTVNFGVNRLICNSFENVFLVKYNSSGNVLWAKQAIIPSLNCNAMGNSVSTDNAGNVYLLGTFYDTLSFSSYSVTSPNSYSAFLAKYSGTGNVLWAKQSINSSIYCNGYSSSVVTDKENNLYITGFFEDTIAFGSYILNSPVSPTVFLTKYDSSGNILWAQQSSAGWLGTGLSADVSNHIYLVGYSSISEAQITFGSFTLNAVPSANPNTFLVKFDPSGTAICGSILENLQGAGIASDSSGNYLYVSGAFYNDTVLCAADTLISTDGANDIFVGRWQNCPVDAGINNIASPTSSVSVYPNPNNGIFQLQVKSEELSSKSMLEVYNVMGEKVFTSTLPPPMGGGISLPIQINISSEPEGIYLYRVLSETRELVGEGKLIIER